MKYAKLQPIHLKNMCTPRLLSHHEANKLGCCSIFVYRHTFHWLSLQCDT